VYSKKLFLFDFDGVIVDGMNEYWHSALLACEKYLNSPDIFIDHNLYKQVSNTFIEMRPWVKYGWEMLIIVHEIIKKENPLNNNNKSDFLNSTRKTTWRGSYKPYMKRILNIYNDYENEALEKIFHKTLESYKEGSRSRKQCATSLSVL